MYVFKRYTPMIDPLPCLFFFHSPSKFHSTSTAANRLPPQQHSLILSWRRLATAAPPFARYPDLLRALRLRRAPPGTPTPLSNLPCRAKSSTQNLGSGANLSSSYKYIPLLCLLTSVVWQKYIGYVYTLVLYWVRPRLPHLLPPGF